MTSTQKKTNRASRLLLSTVLVAATAVIPNVSFAAGPGGFAFGLKTSVERILQDDHAGSSIAGISDVIALRASDNINTRGFALRRDGAY